MGKMGKDEKKEPLLAADELEAERNPLKTPSDTVGSTKLIEEIQPAAGDYSVNARTFSGEGGGRWTSPRGHSHPASGGFVGSIW